MYSIGNRKSQSIILLSSWIFENVPNENCSPLTEKKTKSLRQNKPENPARKERGKGK